MMTASIICAGLQHILQLVRRLIAPLRWFLLCDGRRRAQRVQIRRARWRIFHSECTSIGPSGRPGSFIRAYSAAPLQGRSSRSQARPARDRFRQGRIRPGYRLSDPFRPRNPYYRCRNTVVAHRKLECGGADFHAVTIAYRFDALNRSEPRVVGILIGNPSHPAASLGKNASGRKALR